MAGGYGRMILLRLFWRYARTYTAWILLGAVAVLIYALASAALVSLIDPIFSEVLLADGASEGLLQMLGAGGDGASEGAPSDSFWERFDLKAQFSHAYQGLKSRLGIGPQETVYFVPILFLVVFLLRSVSNFVSGYSFQYIGLGATTRMRNDLYESILGQGSSFFVSHPSGELVSRVVNDVAIMQNAVSNRLFDLVQQGVTLIVLTLLLLSIDLELALICLVGTPLLVWPIVRFGKGMRRTSYHSQERMADLANLVNEGVRGHRVVKAFGMEGFELGRFRNATRRHLRVNLWAQVLSNLSSPVVESMAVIGAAALLIYAGLSIRDGDLSVSLFLTFLFNLVYMYDPIRKLNKVNLVLQQSLAAAQRVAALMAEPLEVVERPDARRLDGFEKEIRFQDVSFGYGDLPVLRGVDLTIRRGETVALVGHSGAGKTTLVNLLPRFFDPDGGAVLIDELDLRDLTLESLREHVGIVTQDTVLFNDTVRNNIAYGRGDVELETVRSASRAAFADEFISRLPLGYESQVGEAGARLSGGQRQRLAIARALLKNAPILILDEATSQLDAEAEALVQKALANLMVDRTTVVIAHRLATVIRADRIVVLDGGRIVQEGTHRELLEAEGIYRRLYDLQFQEEGAPP